MPDIDVDKLMTDFGSFVKEQSSPKPEESVEQPLVIEDSEYGWAGEEEAPPKEEEKPATEPIAPNLQQYAPVIQAIESNPELQKSWTNWYAQNILGVTPQQPQQSQLQPQPQPHPQPQQSAQEIYQQWTEWFQQDPVNANIALQQRLAEQNQQQYQAQLQQQYKPVLGYMHQLAKQNFKNQMVNDPMYKHVEPYIDNILDQIPPEQVQQNPKVFDAAYSLTVGQMIRTGAIKPGVMASKGVQTPPSPMPGSPAPAVGGKARQPESAEDRYLSNVYKDYVSWEDVTKYGGEK